MEPQYAAPPPDFTRLSLSGRLAIAGRECTLQVTPPRRFADYGPEFDVVHVRVLSEDEPLTLYDLNPNLAPDRCYQLWASLCGALQVAITVAYGLEADGSGEPNPRLGCWGARPDLARLGDSDCATALVVGIAVDTRAAMHRPSPVALAQALSLAVMRSLREWEAATTTP
jgi:hypothetical protein